MISLKAFFGERQFKECRNFLVADGFAGFDKVGLVIEQPLAEHHEIGILLVEDVGDGLDTVLTQAG